VKRDFLSVEDWSSDEVDRLLALAARIKRGEVSGGLERKVMAMVFMDPSLRTRTSFETAMFLHGGHAVVLEPGRSSWSLETEPGAVMDGATVEHVRDAARVLGRYADVVGLRSFPRGADWSVARQDRILHDFGQYCEKPVINMESARRHPCQQLADAMTLQERLGDPRGKRFVLLWAWHPKALPTAVPASAALAAAHQGMEVVIGRPDGYELDPDDTALVRSIAQARGGEFVHIMNDPDEAVVGADVVYVKSWGSLKYFGQPEAEAEFRAGLRDWRLSASRLKSTRQGKAAVMHCLPVRRNVEIDDAVLDGPSSVVVDEAENRLHVQRALLLELIGVRETIKGNGERGTANGEQGTGNRER
jgi:N-acetylornithine carbamoyltransferase